MSWETFEEFYEEDYFIHRKDQNKNYCPENCFWSNKQQGRKKITKEEALCQN